MTLYIRTLLVCIPISSVAVLVLIIFQAHYIAIIVIILLRAEITLFTAAAALDLTGAAAILVLVLCNDSFAADKTRQGTKRYCIIEDSQ